MYKIIYSPKAIEDLQKLKRSEPAAYKKADKFIKELKEHPKTGTGHPPFLPASLDNNSIPFPLTGERDVSFWRYGVRCSINIYGLIVLVFTLVFTSPPSSCHPQYTHP